MPKEPDPHGVKHRDVGMFAGHRSWDEDKKFTQKRLLKDKKLSTIRFFGV
ncbi:MAG: hypothetical protein ACU84H_07400 [Gammaproteobacteria bacterium]